MNPPNMPAQPALKMPTTWGDRLLRVQNIQSKLINNSYIPTGWSSYGLTQAQFDLDIATFIDAEVNVKAKMPGAVGLRNAAFKKLMEDLRCIRAMVQGAAYANPEIDTAIIASCGFFVIPKHGRPFRRNAAFNTQVSGNVVMTADGGGAHEWEMSLDMINNTRLPATTTSKTIITELMPGTVYYFRTKKFDTKRIIYNWSPWIRLMVGSGGRNLSGRGTVSSAGSIAA